MEQHHMHLKDRDLVDSGGERIGTISDVIFDEATESDPKWLVVNPGLLKAEHFVPARGAIALDDGTIQVPYDIETVKSSLKAPSDHVVPSAAKAVLRDHYSLPPE